jgi:demethylmenaquinone methyltransferase/2-methoxy-6-polyprenyl-1,4-benzoquinol methylase
VEDRSAKVRGLFAAIAGRYDLVNRVVSLGIDSRWRRRLVALARLGPRSAVLDVAAGTGDVTLALARLGAPARVVSTDLVPSMLALARNKLWGFEGATAIDFVVADGQRLPFADARFDALTVAFGVRNMADRAAHFAEALRVLRPGGRYLCLEFTRPPNAAFRAVYHLYLRAVVPAVGGLLSGDRPAYRYLNDSIRAFPDQAGLAAEMRAAGFADVRWHDLTFGVVAIHVGVR